MKLVNTVVLPALCWGARLTAAEGARIYTYDPQSQPRSESLSNTIEPVPARLVLAQRAGVEDFHKADLVREDVIDAINDYGVRTSLFADERRNKRALLLVESSETAIDFKSSLETFMSLELSPFPGEAQTRGLFVDLVKQADYASFGDIDDSSLFGAVSDKPRSSTGGDMFRVFKSMATFEAEFTRLAKTNEYSISALIVPATSAKTGKSVEFMSHDYQWGTYEMPDAQSPLKKRMQNKEMPLSETLASHPVASFAAPVSPVAANTTRPLRGILPACFTSQAACESTTRNCTGHGSCVRKYHDSTASKDGSVNCFVCACQATKSGKKTTNWGGPACQKKDVSVEFWLIVLFTVGLIGLIGFAIGTIWEMGQQDLPSVIGAGVSGPSARK